MDYFTNVWNIPPGRISISARNLPAQPSNSKVNDGVEENRRVEIASDTWEITAPNIVLDTLRKAYPGTVRFKPVVTAEAGLAKWKLNASHEDLPLVDLAGERLIEKSYDWPIGNRESEKAVLKTSVKYSLSVLDATNRSLITPEKSIPVEITTIKQKQENVTRDTVINTYNLILFDFNKATLGPGNSKIVQFIRDETTPESQVTVAGFTDRMGDDKYNLKLATKRAAATSSAIGHPNTITLGKGESELLYDNNTPEGRFYCRTVVVTVKVPQQKEGEKK